MQRSELPVELQSGLNNLANMLWSLQDYNPVSKRTGHPKDSHPNKNPHPINKNPYHTNKNPYNNDKNSYYAPELNAPRLPSIGQLFPLPSPPKSQTPNKPNLPKYNAVPSGQTHHREQKMQSNNNAVNTTPPYPLAQGTILI